MLDSSCHLAFFAHWLNPMPEQRWLGERAQGDRLDTARSPFAVTQSRSACAAARKLACEVRIFVGRTAPAVECAETILDRPGCDVSDVMLSHSRLGLQHHTSTVMIACCRHYDGKQFSAAPLCVTRRVQAKAMRT